MARVLRPGAGSRRIGLIALLCGVMGLLLAIGVIAGLLTGLGGVVVGALGAVAGFLLGAWLSAMLSHSGVWRSQAERDRHRLETISSRLPVAFYQSEIGELGRWRYVTPQIEQILGYPAQQWISDSGLWARLLHPEDRERVLSHEAEVWGQGPGSSGAIEYRMIARDGHTVWIRDEGVIGTDGYLDGVFTDVTEARGAEERFRRLLEAAPDPMVIVDEAGTIQLVNDEVSRLLGYERDELVGEAVELLVPEKLRARHAGHRGGFAADLQTRPMGTGLDLHVRAKDGSEVPVEISLSPLESDEGTLVIAAIRDVTKQREAEHTLRHLAEHDPLTGVHNRRRFEEELGRAVAAADRYHTPAAVLALDLDNFKDVNDTLGHAAGDELLVSVAKALGSRLRETDAIGRIGGDEFAVVLTHVGTAEARTVSESLLETIRENTAAASGAPMTVSIGVALIDPDRPESPERLLSQADIAMYTAKRTGRDRYFIYGDAEPNGGRSYPQAGAQITQLQPRDAGGRAGASQRGA